VAHFTCEIGPDSTQAEDTEPQFFQEVDWSGDLEIPSALFDTAVILEKVAMNGQEQRDCVICDIFCPVIRDVTDLDPVFPAARNVDDIESDTHSDNHFTVP
jgi:hypothetical protein